MYENDDNLYKAVVFSNPGLRNRMGVMLGSEISSDGNGMKGLNIHGDLNYICNICEEGGILYTVHTKEQIYGILGTIITNVEYGKLRDRIKYIRNKYKPEWNRRESDKNIN